MPRSSGCCRRIRCSRRAEAEEERAAEVPLAGPGRVGEELERNTREVPAVADDSDARGTRDDAPEVSDFADYGSGGDGDWGGGNGSDDDDFLPQQIATSTLRDHLNGQLALLEPAAARPADRRRADRRARRRRLPARRRSRKSPSCFPPSSRSSRRSCRSRSSTCRASSRPAWARATAPNASRCS